MVDEIFKKLTQAIKRHSNVIIMTHKNPDLDGLASAVCLYQIVTSFKKDCYLYMPIGKLHKSVIKMFEKLDKSQMELQIVHKFNTRKFITDNTVLIILDVNKEELLENAHLLKKIKDIIVIDHHIKSRAYIKETLFSYSNSNLSSIAEFMTNYSKYLNRTLSPILATVLLAAIEVDTNSFNIKTTETTYETAAYLAKMGADNIEKQELLKESKEEYLKRQDFIRNSYMITPSIALCTLDDKIYSKADLAILAKELLLFENVEASFVIGKTSAGKVSISARSLGKMNVEHLMEQLGGGGHATEAATDEKDTTISAMTQKLVELIKSEQ